MDQETIKNLYLGLASGLISGLVVSLLVVFISRFWAYVVVPWFEDRIYKDAHIEGKWFGLYPATVDYRQDIVVLKRHGHAICGKMVCVHGDDEGEEYALSGSFRNMILPLTYETLDKHKTDRGTITLICSRNGEQLIGKIALYETMTDRVTTGNIIWFRRKEHLVNAVKEIEAQKSILQKLRAEKREIERQEEDIEANSGRRSEDIVVQAENESGKSEPGSADGDQKMLPRE